MCETCGSCERRRAFAMCAAGACVAHLASLGIRLERKGAAREKREAKPMLVAGVSGEFGPVRETLVWRAGSRLLARRAHLRGREQAARDRQQQEQCERQRPGRPWPGSLKGKTCIAC